MPARDLHIMIYRWSTHCAFSNVWTTNNEPINQSNCSQMLFYTFISHLTFVTLCYSNAQALKRFTDIFNDRENAYRKVTSHMRISDGWDKSLFALNSILQEVTIIIFIYFTKLMWEQESDYLPGANKVKCWLVRLPFDTELKGTWAEKHISQCKVQQIFWGYLIVNLSLH